MFLVGWWCIRRIPPRYFHCASKVCHLTTRICVRLLGPCFKTGGLKPFVPASLERWSSAPPRRICIKNRYQWISPSYTHAQRAGRYARSLCLYPRQGFPCPSHRNDQATSSPPPRIDADQPQAGKAPEGAVEYLRYDMLQPLILLTISGPFSLSFQSAFHLSFTVLVRYRSLANI